MKKEKQTEIVRNNNVRAGRPKTGNRKKDAPKASNVRSDNRKTDGATPNDRKADGAKSNNRKVDGAKPNHTKAGSRKLGSVKSDSQKKSPCPFYQLCGSCRYLHLSYEEQLKEKEKKLKKLLGGFGQLEPMIGMEHPWHYRNKVNATYALDRRGVPYSGIYRANSHEVVPVHNCLIEDEKAGEMISAITRLLPSFKIRVYDEDTQYGLLRHVLVKRAFATGQIMVVLVLASPVLPSKQNFVRALLKLYPEITTVVLNVNPRGTSAVLGDREIILYGPGYIEDVLCGHRFRISARSFYQVNPVQTEILYRKAIEYAGLTGRERVIDAYCGVGTIGMIASHQAGEVLGIERNADAVRDARGNAKRNEITNIHFVQADATEYLMQMAVEKEKADVLLMDPPRSGSTPEFLRAAAAMGPKRIVYISCGPDSLARDLEVCRRLGYQVKKMQGIDCFPWVDHVETVVLLSKGEI